MDRGNALFEADVIQRCSQPTRNFVGWASWKLAFWFNQQQQPVNPILSFFFAEARLRPYRHIANEIAAIVGPIKTGLLESGFAALRLATAPDRFLTCMTAVLAQRTQSSKEK